MKKTYRRGRGLDGEKPAEEKPRDGGRAAGAFRLDERLPGVWPAGRYVSGADGGPPFSD